MIGNHKSWLMKMFQANVPTLGIPGGTGFVSIGFTVPGRRTVVRLTDILISLYCLVTQALIWFSKLYTDKVDTGLDSLFPLSISLTHVFIPLQKVN